jgi:magnesium chelatase family protein
MRGKVQSTRGVLPFLVDYAKHRESDDADERQFVVPYDNAIEASYANTGTSISAIAHVSELLDLPAHTVAQNRGFERPKTFDHLYTTIGQLPTRVVRALEIASVGGHSIHLIGSLAFKAARTLYNLLPPMSQEEAIESASMLSIAGLLQPEQIGLRPFRAPHHTVEPRGLVGGGDPIRAGEVSLAHNGVLYLDSLPEFKRGAIEPLAATLRQGTATVSRLHYTAEFPAKPLLVTGCSRCPYSVDHEKKQHSAYCTPERVQEWQRRHVDTLGIEMVVDCDFGPDDVAYDGGLAMAREQVAQAVEFGTTRAIVHVDPDDDSIRHDPKLRLARTIANLDWSAHVLVKHSEEASRLYAR